MPDLFKSFLARKWWFLAAYLIVLALAIYKIPSAHLDASSDSLTLETDPGLALYREISAKYRSGDFFVVAYEAEDGDVLSEQSLSHLTSLTSDLASLAGIESVTSILNVPLLQSPAQGLDSLGDAPRTLGTHEVDVELARAEFQNSPVYKNTLVSKDSTTTAVLLSLPVDLEYYRLVDERNSWLLKSELSAEEQVASEQAQRELIDYRTQRQDQEAALLAELRSTVDSHKDRATLFIGGVPMIASDMLSFIRQDLTVFGAASIALMVLALALFFKSWRWVFIPLAISSSVVVIVAGALAWMDWRLSIISANFASLLLIISLSIGIHLTVRFREYWIAKDHDSLDRVLWQTLKAMIKPCAFAVLTTLVAFLSLIASGIRPVIDFGMIMSVGMVLALFVCFFLFPILVSIIGPGNIQHRDSKTALLLASWGNVALNRPKSVYLVSIAALIAFGIGSTMVKVENRFIDYFDESTEIYQGMALIDRQLGGTTPLEIVIDAPAAVAQPAPSESVLDDVDDEYGDGFDDGFADGFDDGFSDGFDDGFSDGFDDFSDGESTANRERTPSWWFSMSGVREVRELHSFIESLDASGKVVSLATTVDVAEMLSGDPLDDFTLAFLQTVMPDDVNERLVEPYWHRDTDQTRIEVRIVDSTPGLVRQHYVAEIERFAKEEMQLGDRVEVTGMLVLYNNMVQSLFDSQITTLATVFLGIFVMFVVLFRSFILAIVAIIPNALAALCIIGFMGLADIPLDFMTITIAAIVVGIGVDDCIHYMVRFLEEYKQTKDKSAALMNAHSTIGSAMSYTSWTIVLGFAVLALSLFTPSVVFGLLTASAMILALAGALILMPRLMMLVPDRVFEAKS